MVGKLPALSPYAQFVAQCGVVNIVTTDYFSRGVLYMT